MLVCTFLYSLMKNVTEKGSLWIKIGIGMTGLKRNNNGIRGLMFRNNHGFCFYHSRLLLVTNVQAIVTKGM